MTNHGLAKEIVIRLVDQIIAIKKMRKFMKKMIHTLLMKQDHKIRVLNSTLKDRKIKMFKQIVLAGI